MQNWRTIRHCRTPDEATEVINRMRKTRTNDTPLRRWIAPGGITRIQERSAPETFDLAAASTLTRPKPYNPNDPT